MGKTKAAKASPRAAPAEVSEEVRSKVDALVNDGNKAFAKREYTKALESFGAAAKALPEAAADKANLLCNKAACYYQLKRFKEAAKECSNALDIAPNSAKALQRRARSLEQQGLYKQALSDIQAVNRTDAATDESRDIERRLRDAVAGRRPAGLGAALAPSPAPPANGAARAAAAAQAAAAAAQQQQRQAQLQAQQQQAQAQAQQQRQVFTLSAKVTLGEETRQLSLTASTSYAQLLELVHAKFPEAGPFQLKYTDKEGDSITITSRVDVRAAVQDLVASAAQPKGGVPPILPPLRLALVPCAEADVPRPPQEEALQAEALRRSHEAAAAKIALQRRQAAAEREAAAAAAAAAAGAPQVATTPGGEVVEIDDWLIDFANLFRDVSGVDAERHVEIQNEGWDATTRAMEATLRSDEALPIFESAAERFKEVTCTGLLNWGNVSVCVAHKLLDDLADSGADLGDDLAKRAEEAFTKAEARYKEALGFHPDYFDGLCALGQLEFERAKLRAKLIVKPTPPPPAAGTGAGADADAERAAVEAAAAAQAEALRAALAKVKKEDVEAARAHMDTASGWYKKAVAAAEAADARRLQEQERRAARRAGKEQQQAAAPATPEPQATFAAQTRIMEGNALFEWSQLLAAAGAAEWRGVLDSAVALFKAAACSDADVRGALKNHTHAAELDLGPEPAEQEQSAAAGGEKQGEKGEGKGKEEEKPAAAAKGLPSLDKKKKNKK